MCLCMNCDAAVRHGEGAGDARPLSFSLAGGEGDAGTKNEKGGLPDEGRPYGHSDLAFGHRRRLRGAADAPAIDPEQGEDRF